MGNGTSKATEMLEMIRAELCKVSHGEQGEMLVDMVMVDSEDGTESIIDGETVADKEEGGFEEGMDAEFDENGYSYHI